MGSGYLLHKYCPRIILEALAPLYCNYITRSASLRAYCRWFDATDSWSRETLTAYQWAAMKKILNHAAENVPFYRETWKAKKINVSDIAAYDDLVNLPVLSKDDFREHSAELFARGVAKKKLTFLETGGSTGMPIHIYHDRETRNARSAAFARWDHYAGRMKPTEMLFYMGRPHFRLMDQKDRWGDQGERYFGEYWALARRGFLACTNLTDTVMARYCDLLEKHKPPFLKGYASGLHVLADYCTQSGRKMNFIKAVMTSSEMVSARQRDLTRQAWNCEVFDRYGLTEEVATAAECAEHNGYHLDMVKCLVEVVDDAGRQVSDTPGDLIGTCLTNYAMPLIRYKTGDTATLTGRTCACGRESLMLESLRGRTDNMIIASSGRGIGATTLGTMVIGLFSIREVQYIQNRQGHLTIKVVCSSEFEKDKPVLISRLKMQLGQTFEISTECVDRIPRGSNGKFRQIISSITGPG